MPPVVIGIIQTLTEGQSVTDKLLGLCLISQLLLFRLTLQLNRETELLIYFITEEEEEERKRMMKENSRGIQRKEDDKEDEEEEEMREKMKRKGRER